ncbi:MAG TPA: hypothetical protein PLT20_02705 [Sedimentisphaerales bacterium]|nr:hypothetical protein [Sedimentisphaerales bacterium]HQI26970.1 hypothetical protein [Sedimentisphaerales bacterium]
MWTLDDRCFKIDKTNAKAMINGYLRNGVLIRQAIWCAVKDAPFPMLITLNRTRTKFQMSRIGENLLSDDYIIPYKYIADVDPDDEYFIRNDPRLWATVCNNGLFDIWMPEAPYKRFADAKSDPTKFRIQLIRIWQIQEEFAEHQIRFGDHFDHLISCNKNVTPDQPVITDTEFRRIRTLLISSVKDFRTK